MSKFRKKPITIEAFQWTNGPDQAYPFWFADAMRDGKAGENADKMSMYIETLEGTMTAFPGDWIIRGIKNEIYSCKPDIFAATYEPAE